MAVELIVNVLLLMFSVFCFFYVGATMPTSPVNELGAEQWPQALLIILFLALLWNIRNYFKRNEKEDVAQAFKQFLPDIVSFLKSKLFIGMILLMVMAYLYEPLGFIATSLLFLISYGVLLGQRKPLVLILSSVAITLLLYVGFSVFLGVMLPRGFVPFLRELALFFEAIVQGIAG
mgnify:CR=1 FL=1